MANQVFFFSRIFLIAEKLQYPPETEIHFLHSFKQQFYLLAYVQKDNIILFFIILKIFVWLGTVFKNPFLRSTPKMTGLKTLLR